MRFSKFLLRLINGLIDFTIAISLIIAGIYASYALWDNSLIYAAADNVQDDMLKLKPEDKSPSFEDLIAINPDVKGWLILDNTNIDHPILQGESNLTYINTDIYGDFSLAGSIFLDSRNNENFEDKYSLIYGHHMANSKMFGDLDLYKDEKFFRENKTGKLILPDRVYKLEIFACMLVPSSDGSIFNPTKWQGSIDDLIEFTMKTSLYIDENIIGRIVQSIDRPPQVLALTTCSSEFIDARSVILAVMVPFNQ